MLLSSACSASCPSSSVVVLLQGLIQIVLNSLMTHSKVYEVQAICCLLVGNMCLHPQVCRHPYSLSHGSATEIWSLLLRPKTVV